MSENKISEIIKTSVDGIRDLTDTNTVIGQPINTVSGATVIPVSKVTVGFLNGGVDFGQKKLNGMQNFGCGGGTGMAVTPLAFLVVGHNSEVTLVSISEEKDNVGHALGLIERAPEIIDKIKGSLS